MDDSTNSDVIENNKMAEDGASEENAGEGHAGSEEDFAAGYADGTWEGEGRGLNGPIRTAVVVEDGKITEIKILEQSDDESYFTDARQGIVSEILKQQTSEVDTVSGATFSSEGIVEAVREALTSAMKGEPESALS